MSSPFPHQRPQHGPHGFNVGTSTSSGGRARAPNARFSGGAFPGLKTSLSGAARKVASGGGALGGEGDLVQGAGTAGFQVDHGDEEGGGDEDNGEDEEDEEEEDDDEEDEEDEEEEDDDEEDEEDEEEDDGTGESAYEKLRRLRMAQNQAFLAELGFGADAKKEESSVMRVQNPMRSRAPRVELPVLPSRRSSRNQGKEQSYDVEGAFR